MFVWPKSQPSGFEQRGEIGGDEIGVFEDAEHHKIAGDREAQRPFAARADVAVDDDRGGVIEGDGEQEDEQETRLAPGIEDQREEQRDDILADDGRGQDIKGDENRQEIEKERDRRKHHARIAFASPA